MSYACSVGDDDKLRPEERLLPGHHAESLSAAQLAADESASDDGSSEPEPDSSDEEDERLGGAADPDAEQLLRRGTKRSRKEAEEGVMHESLTGHDRDAAGVLHSVNLHSRIKLVRCVRARHWQQHQSS